MKVEQISLSGRLQDKNEYGNAIIIKIDDEKVFRVHDGEKEDNNITRNFKNCWNIVKLMKRAYDAGMKDEDFKSSETITDDDEWYFI